MTQKRRDDHSTEFGLWLREQPEIDSGLGFVAINIDYVWQNYRTGDWMIIEEKRYGRQPKFYQERILDMLNKCGGHDPRFHGTHILVFENTNPEDGNIFLDGKQITKTELLMFLSFKKDLRS
jgi:hypothetical protein